VVALAVPVHRHRISEKNCAPATAAQDLVHNVVKPVDHQLARKVYVAYLAMYCDAVVIGRSDKLGFRISKLFEE
jgi:hypothetical protein